MKKVIFTICLIYSISFLGCSVPKNDKAKVEESKIQNSKGKEEITNLKSSLKTENIKEISIAKMPSPPKEKIIDKKEDIEKILKFLDSIKVEEKIEGTFKGWSYTININSKEKYNISFLGDKIGYKNQFYKIDKKNIEELDKLYEELKYIETDLSKNSSSQKGSYLGEKDNINVDLSNFTLNKGDDNYCTVNLIHSPLDKDNLKVSFKKLQGVYTMGVFQLNKGEKLYLDYKGKMEQGKLNMVIQDDSYNILKIVEVNKEELIEVEGNKDGKYIIRLVGDMASNGEISLKVKPTV